MALRTMYRMAKAALGNRRIMKTILFSLSMKAKILPKVLTVSLTYDCQCDCSHCGISDYRKKEGADLTTPEVKRLIDEARKIRSIVQVTFTGGEALLRQDILELVRYAKGYHFFIKIDSNAVLLEKKILAALKQAGADVIGISIDHHQRAMHDSLRRHDGLFEKVIASVHLCRELDIRCYLQTYATRDRLREGDLEKIVALSESLGAEKCIVQLPALLSHLKGRGEAGLEPDDYRALDGISSRHPTCCVESDIYPVLQYRNFCKVGLRTNVHLTAYGDVQACCWLPFSFGNIRQDSLGKIVRSMYASKSFKELLSRDGCLCSDQDFLSRYLSDAGGLPVRMRESL
jgi:MoaA/NifB/PqqE/SkfB family radical SAM enzyme